MAFYNHVRHTNHSNELQQMVLFCVKKAVWQTVDVDIAETQLSE